MKKVIILISDTGVNQSFEIEHAERILKIPNSGWRLPEDSEFTFDLKNGIDFSGNTGQVSEPRKRERNNRRNFSTESD